MSKITTENEVRLSYTNLLEPRPRDAEHPDELQFSTAVLIPKTDTKTIEAVKAAIAAALVEGTAKKWNGKRPANLKNPLRDGDTDRPDDEVYAGHMFFNAKGPKGGKDQPVLLDKNGRATTSSTVIYSGVYARGSFQFYAFDVNGNRGIAAGVTAILSQEHGDALGNVVTEEGARSEFGVATPASTAAAEFEGGTPDATSEAAPAADEDVWAS